MSSDLTGAALASVEALRAMKTKVDAVLILAEHMGDVMSDDTRRTIWECEIAPQVDRVRAVLDPWREGPPGESGTYEVDNAVEFAGYTRLVCWGANSGVAWHPENQEDTAMEGWTHSSEDVPSRYRALRLGTPPARPEGERPAVPCRHLGKVRRGDRMVCMDCGIDMTHWDERTD